MGATNNEDSDYNRADLERDTRDTIRDVNDGDHVSVGTDA